MDVTTWLPDDHVNKFSRVFSNWIETKSAIRMKWAHVCRQTSLSAFTMAVPMMITNLRGWMNSVPPRTAQANKRTNNPISLLKNWSNVISNVEKVSIGMRSALRQPPFSFSFTRRNSKYTLCIWAARANWKIYFEWNNCFFFHRNR